MDDTDVVVTVDDVSELLLAFLRFDSAIEVGTDRRTGNEVSVEIESKMTPREMYGALLNNEELSEHFRPNAFWIPTGEDLKELREMCGMSMNEASNRAGIAHETVRRIEKSPDSNPEVDTVESLLEVYREDLAEESFPDSVDTLADRL